jgi:uncharacterized protein
VHDPNEQLAELRRQLARINLKYRSAAARTPAPAPDLDPESDSSTPSDPGADLSASQDPEPLGSTRPVHYFADEFMSGELVHTPHGSHFETEKLFERHRRHGSIEISELNDLPHDLFEALSDSSVKACDPSKWAFLDTETTGLAGGAGTVAFLVGVGRVAPDGFRVRQFFMRDYGEEASLLHSLTAHLRQFDVLVTYNGKTYDQPLLETRYRMCRMRPPFDDMGHLDLLHGARRIWKLRFDSCRLMELENQILGVEREGDLPGQMIPYVYFEYVRTRQAFRLVPLFHHNYVDIVTLACLAAIVPWAFRSPEQAPLRHGSEWLGLARWLLRAGEEERALQMMRRAVECGLPDSLVFRALWDVALLEKKLDRESASLAVLSELAGCSNPFRIRALEELAKHYEHKERNYDLALEWTRMAMAENTDEALCRREARLLKRLSKGKPRRLL